MLRFKKNFLALVLFLSLPLQGVTAVTMPFCQHKLAAHYAAMTDQGHAVHQHSQQKGTLVCDDCAFCQLCAAPALPTIAAITPARISTTLNPELPVHFFLFIPEQPKHPPLPVLA